MSSKVGETIYSDINVTIINNGENSLKYIFRPNSFNSNGKIMSTFLKYFSWEFKYMSKDALIDMIKGSYDLCKDSLDWRDLKFLNSLNDRTIESLELILWNLILSGEGIGVDMNKR